MFRSDTLIVWWKPDLHKLVIALINNRIIDFSNIMMVYQSITLSQPIRINIFSMKSNQTGTSLESTNVELLSENFWDFDLTVTWPSPDPYPTWPWLTQILLKQDEVFCAPTVRLSMCCSKNAKNAKNALRKL